jgi:NitT/TauT family transport system ATP-binding protein
MVMVETNERKLNEVVEIPRAPKPKIEIESVSRIFHSNNANRRVCKDYTALANVSLNVQPGEFVALLGPSGCGKSTLLDMLTGLSFPTSGSIRIDGKQVDGPSLDRGIILQGYTLLPWRTVRKNVEFGLEVKKIAKKDYRDISDSYLRLVGLSEFANRYPHELSGGMKQRVAIARALAFNPEILLMDEPFGALDAQTSELLQDELLRIWEAKRKTIVFVTHSIDEAVFLADRVVVMSASPGRILEVVKIDLPRPRQDSDVRLTPEFGRIRHRVWELLHQHSSYAAQHSESALQYAQ